MGNCKDCRWWGQGNTDKRGYGKCSIVVPREHVEAAPIAYIEGGSTMFTLLATRPDFGCVQFERRETVINNESSGEQAADSPESPPQELATPILYPVAISWMVYCGDFEQTPMECCDCPFATVNKSDYPPNLADPGEGYYDCALLGEDKVWGENPKCKLKDWQERARTELKAGGLDPVEYKGGHRYMMRQRQREERA